MVSRRNFITISMIMFVVVFLFQFSNFAKEHLNDYSKNAYEKNKDELLDRTSVQKRRMTEQETQENTVIYIGIGTTKSIGAVLSEWCTYKKKRLIAYDDLSMYLASEQSKSETNPEFMVIDQQQIHWDQEAEVAQLTEWAKQGIHLIICGTPDVSYVRRYAGVRELLGIESVVEDETTVAGLHLYQGLLLGGEVTYQASNADEEKMQDMELTFPWFRLSNATKVYMKGIPKDESVKKEDYPVVIWRKSFGSGYVFTVNGSYMEELTGMGLLSGMWKEVSSYSIYPVLNAQNMIVANFPGMTDENEEQMNQIYSQSLTGVFRDVIWPSVAAIHQNNQIGLSCMLAPQYDYADANQPQTELLTYYLKLINEESAEAGLTGTCISTSTTILDKLDADEQFLKNAMPGFSFSSFYQGDLPDNGLRQALQKPIMKNVRTIVEKWNDKKGLVGYKTTQITRQKALINGFEQTSYGTDFMVRGIETALGYGSIMVDMNQVAYPESRQYYWENLSKVFAINVSTYWKAFSKFDATTVSETDDKIRNFLAMNYDETRNGNVITLNISETKGANWFVLRTDQEKIKKVTGGTYKKLEDGAWLIKTDSDHVEIEVTKASQPLYH